MNHFQYEDDDHHEHIKCSSINNMEDYFIVVECKQYVVLIINGGNRRLRPFYVYHDTFIDACGTAIPYGTSLTLSFRFFFFFVMHACVFVCAPAHVLRAVPGQIPNPSRRPASTRWHCTCPRSTRSPPSWSSATRFSATRNRTCARRRWRPWG